MEACKRTGHTTEIMQMLKEIHEIAQTAVGKTATLTFVGCFDKIST